MPSATLALTLFPVSADYRTRLEQRLGYKPDYCLVSDLRHGGIANLARWLWKSRYRRVLLPYEVDEARSVLPIVQLLAAAHKLPEIYLCSPELEITPVEWSSIAFGAVGLARASLDGYRARRRSAARVAAVLRSPSRQSVLSPDPQRVLYIKNNMWFGLRAGGSVGHVAGVVNGLVELGHEVTFFSPESPRCLSPGVHIAAVPMFRNYAFPAEANLFRVQECAEREADSVVKAFRPTLVYQRQSLGDWTGVHVAERFGLPLIVEYNGSEVWVSKNWGAGLRHAQVMEQAEEAMLRRADLVFTISEPLRDELIDRGIPSERVAWYPNCVDPNKFDPQEFDAAARRATRRKLGAGEDDFVLVFIGTFGPWHGAEVFAHAAARLAEDREWMRKNRVRFAFIGDGKTRAECAGIIAKSPAASHAVFTGLVPQHEAPAFLHAADAFVSPHVPNADGSRFFGSPTKLFEYMAMERPIVASALDQIGEVLADGRTAIMVKPGDAAELAQGLRKAVEDRDLGRRLARAARTEALEKYTWTTHVQKILSALQRIPKATRS
jgi:glycosyltransferase involved in cell wall biosynthesis